MMGKEPPAAGIFAGAELSSPHLYIPWLLLTIGKAGMIQEEGVPNDD